MEVAGPNQASVKERFVLVDLLARGPRAIEGLKSLRGTISDNFDRDIKTEKLSRQKQALSTMASGFEHLNDKVGISGIY